MEKIRDPHSPLGLDAYCIRREKHPSGKILLATDAAGQPALYTRGPAFAETGPLLLFGDEARQRPLLGLSFPRDLGEKWGVEISLPATGARLGQAVWEKGRKGHRHMSLLSPQGELLLEVVRGGGILGGGRLFFDRRGRQAARLTKAGLAGRGWRLSLAPHATVTWRPLVMAASFLHVILRRLPPAQLAWRRTARTPGSSNK